VIGEGMTEEMTCKELVEVITDYLEGTMPEQDRQRFEEHLAACPYCVNYLDQMRMVIRTLGRLSEDTIPPGAREQLLHAFRDWKRA
jgi:anti-sigma factor (TIGR02949 family)